MEGRVHLNSDQEAKIGRKTTLKAELAALEKANGLTDTHDRGFELGRP